MKNIRSYKGMKRKKMPSRYFSDVDILCPNCRGFGGWHNSNVKVESHCSQCNGWGWVSREDSKCIHKFKLENIGKCLHLWTCRKCKIKREVDSSD
jgi:RecJ-like exonuclease